MDFRVLLSLLFLLNGLVNPNAAESVTQNEATESTELVAAEPAISKPLTTLEAFEQWKQQLEPAMLQQGASESLVKDILQSLVYLPRVVELDRRQPESVMSHETYLSKVIPEWKVKRAREEFKKNLTLLQQAEQSTGVAARFIVALWGKESNFGTITGNFHVPSALATLAFDGRRAKFFERELMAATKILAEGHVSNREMLGSWAGAMGNSQFMPSSFLRYAVDANGDGKKDIWSDKQDIFASMGNFLARSGWQKDRTWGRQVKLLQPFESYKTGKKNGLSLAEWQRQGVRRSDLSDLPKAELEAYMIAPGGEKGRIYLVYSNFDVLMRWNRSHYFATGVGYLADRIGYPKIK